MCLSAFELPSSDIYAGNNSMLIELKLNRKNLFFFIYNIEVGNEGNTVQIRAKRISYNSFNHQPIQVKILIEIIDIF